MPLGPQMDSPRGHMFYIGIILYRENMIFFSCLKPQGLEPWYLVWSLSVWVTCTDIRLIKLIGNAKSIDICSKLHNCFIQRFHVFNRIIHCIIKRLCTYDSLSCFSEVSMWLRDSNNGRLLDHRGASYCCDCLNPSLHVPYSWTAFCKRGVPTVFQRKS